MLQHIFTPFRLKHLVLKNRILSTAHAPSYAEDSKPKLRYQLYHEEKAKGGIALTMFGGSSTVSADSPASFGQISVADDSIIPHFQSFAERIHAHDVAIMCQISHMGRRTTWDTGAWLPPVAPSCVREPAHGSFPKIMEAEDFKRITTDYGAAAWRCQEGGLDGCEVFISGHLLGQFWSPLVNQRDDDYGGKLANRLRFTFEVLAEIRRRVGDGFILGLRFSADEMLEGGVRLNDTLEIAGLLADSGLVDYFNIVSSHNWSHIGLARSVPGMAFPGAPSLKLAAEVRKASKLPVFHAARIADLATAEYAIKEGLVDMVGMMRAHMADPHLITKHLAGRDEEIRPCVGTGYCLDRIYHGREALCLYNAATGREATMPHIIAKAGRPGRKIVVVGAGPAGLEAARVCAERGHRVVLFEAASEAGGQVLLAAKASWRRELIGIVRWLLGRVEALGIELRYNCYAEAADVLAEKPDGVIIATGGLPNLSFLDGAQYASSTWDVLSGDKTPGESVLLFDDHGQHQGLSTAEFLAEKGAQVEFMTPERAVGSGIGPTNFAIHLRNLYQKQVRLTTNWRLQSVLPDDNRLLCTLRNEYADLEETRTVDQVVIEHGTLPLDELYFALKQQSSNLGEIDLSTLSRNEPQSLATNPSGEFQLFRIGDAVASRNIHAAVFDALRICKDL